MSQTFGYTCSCKDKTTDQIGCFIFDEAVPFVAISPVFSSLVPLYAYMDENGWETYQGIEPWRCRKATSLEVAHG